MPPSRHQSLKEAKQHPQRPYSRSHTSSNSNDATAPPITTAPSLSKKKRSRHPEMTSTEHKQQPPLTPRTAPAATGSSAIEGDNSKEDKERDHQEKRRRRKIKEGGRLPSSEMELDNKDVKPSTTDRERDASRVRPLASHSTTSGNTQHSNLPYPQPHLHITSHPFGNIPPVDNKPPSTPSSTTKIQKLEAKVDKQRVRLKEAEAKVLKGEEKSRKDLEKIQALEAKIKVHEGVLKAKQEEVAHLKSRAEEHAKTIEAHHTDKEQLKETLQEAINCLICADIPRDPHILSCGHIACRDCLINWFRQPNAYVHPIHGDISPTRDLSYRSKVCPTCRTTVVRRPTRTYSLYAFLEPLGIMPTVPAVSPSQETGDAWENIFPMEKVSYRLHDEEDGVPRCPNCIGEIYDNVCDRCDVEFSEGDSESDMDEDDDEHDHDRENSDEWSDEAPEPVRLRYAQARPRGTRRARVDIATIEEVLGENEEIAHDHGHDVNNEGDGSDLEEPFVNVHTRGRHGQARRPSHPTGHLLGMRGHLGRNRPDHPANQNRDEHTDSDGSHSHPDFDVTSLSDHSIDPDEYDGAVPRVFPRQRVMSENENEHEHEHDHDNDEIEETDDEYEDSFIDDGEEEEEGYDLESTGSLRDGEDEENAVASASEDLNVDVEDENEDQDQDPDSDEIVAVAPEETNPTIEEMRERRQIAFGNAQRRPGSEPAHAHRGRRGGTGRTHVDLDQDSNDEL